MKEQLRLVGLTLKKIPADQVMDLIGYVSQDNFLFNVSVRENIRMGNPNASDQEVEEIAKAAGCHEFIMGLEHGYETLWEEPEAICPVENARGLPLPEL